MALEGYSPVVVDSLGGRCTVVPRAALPLGKSPDCADVKFTPGSVSTRDGLTLDDAADRVVNSLSTFVANDGTQTLIVQGETGVIYTEGSPRANATFAAPVGTVPIFPLAPLTSDQGGSMLKGTTLFNKHWMCISDGKTGEANPFYYDGTGIYVAGPEGPARPPTVTAVADDTGFLPQDVVGSYAWLDPVAQPEDSWPIVTDTVKIAVPPGTSDLVVGHSYPLMNAAMTLYRVNGEPGGFFSTMTVLVKDAAASTVQFNRQWSATSSTVGLAQAIDDVIEISPAGTRGRAVRYAWLMKSGYVSQLSPPGYAPTHAGNCKYNVSNIDAGPPGCVARIFFVEVQVGVEMFHVAAKMTLGDNSTTTFTINFTDEELLQGLSWTAYKRQYALSPFAGVCTYNERLVWWRGRALAYPRLDDKGLLSTSFNAGVYVSGGARLPSGWTAGAGVGTVTVENPSVGSTNGLSVLFAAAGAAGNSPTLTQSANIAPEGTGITAIPKKYAIRMRLKRGSMATPGTQITATVSISGGGGGGTIATATVPLSVMSDAYYLTFDTLAPGNIVVPAGGTTLSISLHATYAGTALDKIYVEGVSLRESTDVRAPLGQAIVSRAGDPEAIDADTGAIAAGPDDGQDLGCCFALRGSLYLAKRTSLYCTQDNGQEPLFWDVQEVSSTCGTPSVNGVGKGDGWALLAGPNGAYLFDGGVPTLLSYDILPDWQRINWAAGEKVWCLVDAERKVAYIGAPVDSSTECNLTYVMDFSRGLDADSRQWALWNRGFRAGAIMPATEQTSRVLFACYTAAAPGAVVHLDNTRTDDFDGLIPAYYTTAPFCASVGRSSFERFVVRVMGEGSFPVSAIRPGGAVVPLQPATLSASPDNDPEFGNNLQDTQISLRLGDPAAPVKNWFVTKVVAMMKNATYGFLRGKN
jgi:hypothetical protein